MKLIDLHIHTTHSDGTLSPKKVINYSIRKKMKVIAITDHNTLSGIGKALKFSIGKNIEIVPGVEIDCKEDPLNLKDIHVLGLFINPKDKVFLEALNKQQKLPYYLFRIIKIFLKRTIFANLFIKIAAVLRKHRKEALKKPKLSLKDTISLIKSAGGIAILAHPGIIEISKLKKLVDQFIVYGGGGLEANYPYDKIYLIKKEESDKMNEFIRKIALGRNIAISGGSDFHGYGRNVKIGDGGLTLEDYKKLKSFK